MKNKINLPGFLLLLLLATGGATFAQGEMMTEVGDRGPAFLGVDQLQLMPRPSTEEEKALPAASWVIINPLDVTVFHNRVHIMCPAVNGGISYFAVSSADADMTNKVISLVSTAIVYGKNLAILYDPNDLNSGPRFGCLSKDCRVIQAIALKK